MVFEMGGFQKNSGPQQINKLSDIDDNLITHKKMNSEMKFKKISEGSATATTTSYVEKATFTDTAEDENAVYKFSVCEEKEGDGTGVAVTRIVIDDGTNTITLDSNPDDLDDLRFFEGEIYKAGSSATKAFAKTSYFNVGNPENIDTNLTTHTVIAAFMATTKTFSIQAKAQGSQEAHIRWRVERWD